MYVIDFKKNPPEIVAVNYANIPDFFHVCIEYNKDDLQIEFAYSTKGQATGRDGIDLTGNFKKGEKYVFRINDILITKNIINAELIGMNIETEDEIDIVLRQYRKYIKENIELFTNPDAELLKNMLKERTLRLQENLKKAGY